jgi:ATP-dependent DNA helicase PIF1
LKKGAVILLMRNLDVKQSHCNGSRYIIEDITQRLIIAKRLHACDENDAILIPRVPSHTKDTELPFIMKRLQFPLKLAFVMTFNRAQGQSMKHCGILLPQSLWAHGQLYVGVSRCSARRNLKIWADQTEFRNMNLPPGQYTRNVVYTELFVDD